MNPVEISALAARLGINISAAQITAYRPKSDGLSGGVSRLYSLRGRVISCEWAGVDHDCLYDRGGNKADRKRADRLFLYAAALSGKFIAGWLENAYHTGQSIQTVQPVKMPLMGWPFVRLGWRCLRAIIMYYMVRWFAWGRRHWTQKKAL